MKITERWRHLRGDFVKHMAFGLLLIPLHSLLAVVASAAAVYFATTGRALIQQHPLSSMAAAVAAIPVIYLLYRGFVFRIRRHREYERIRQVAEGCGIEGFWGRTTRAEKEDGWSDCVGKIAAAGSSEILIAGLTGAATFARDDAPLHEVIHAHKGDVRILLIQKDSAAFDQRIDELSGGDEAAKEQLTRCCECSRTAGYWGERKFYIVGMRTGRTIRRVYRQGWASSIACCTEPRN